MDIGWKILSLLVMIKSVRNPLALIAVVAFLCSSCSLGKKVQISEYAGLISCHQQRTFKARALKPRPINELNIDTALINHFGFASLNIANAFGFLDLLQQLVKAKEDFKRSPVTENRLRRIETTMKLSGQINLASLEISSFASELDCEEERITQVADFLKGKEKQRETRLTVAAIGIGAIGGVASGLLSSNDNAGHSGDYVGIGTGIAEAILGVLILKNSMITELQHPRNVLKDIWYGQDSSIFPPSVWYFITYKNPAKPNELSLREKIKESWKGFNQVAVDNTEEMNKFTLQYFQDKGVYGTDDLYNRAKMYDQIESYVKMIKQDLTTLSLELEDQDDL
ncbi:hypothetical protein OQX61_00360 [Pedobacter sp. PLR]|uniref:hypothetical protein n=1 Tax=Pedobacter sp. PLR TaxID=2994465 RepID=UPI002247BD01|nr:hypothetical protein [Pedobacter sp. PLR]MCX2449707.1 hypothetical protein [Pedobacter sp. PLR]